ncbi:hypothetical protein QUA42_27000 [Microcoleus sp. Pol11C2]|uniref:hypothetical protein n=1 Tax=Microcoleus sp. Pol11C2 TaxID=3055389 RepID=UPI002FD25647
MSKIEFNTEEQEVVITRRIGRGGESTVTVSPEAAGIEINLGIAKIGATTDFGGAITLGIAGQEVTWGREGGTIHIGIGGFSVDVEARDCIVTEVKSIFGIIVAQRSYPDPGCELPEPSAPPDPPVPDGKIPAGIEIPSTLETAYVICDGFVDINTSYPWGSLFFTNSWFSHWKINLGALPDNILSPPNSLPYSVEVNQKGSSACSNGETIGIESRYVYASKEASGHSCGSFFVTFWSHGATVTATGSRLYNGKKVSQYPPLSSNGFSIPSGDTAALILYGPLSSIKGYIECRNKSLNMGLPTATQYKLVPVKIIRLGKAKNQPFLPTGNKPPMQNCCEEVLDILEEFREFVDIARFLKDGFPIANTFMAPGCDPAAVTKNKTAYEILQSVVRMMAHGMIFEPRVNIKDADAAKAGDQEFKAKYLNATGWASAVAEALLEVKDDGNVSTNMDIRNGFAATQTMVGLADAVYRLNAILDSLGVELIPKIETVDTPYNVQIQIGKGFGEGNERQIDLNTDEATEKLLPTFLQVKRNKIKTVDVHPRSRSIKDILENIEANLPGRNNG